MLTLIENGEVYTPEPVGRQSVFLTDGKIGKAGPINRKAVETLGVEYEVIDASGCLVVPGLIDPHVHLLGGSGEKGFSSQTPEFFISELVRFGITTVVGVLASTPPCRRWRGCWPRPRRWRRMGSTPSSGAAAIRSRPPR